ncbi:AAEL017353-PA [Aedes aegypti]|uniref:AAEL017353-PA n=1 Tax=Aedes aegypti TaxID=7159 RepID=J9HGM1_AEDAE|nr:AAEL017353-PA [Aedes aegypti]
MKWKITVFLNLKLCVKKPIAVRAERS